MNRYFSWIRYSMAVARFSILGYVLGLAHVSLGQEDAIPLVDEEQNLLARRNDVFWKGESARRALQSGLYELAERYSQEALDGLDGNDGELRENLRLLQVDALLGRGLYDRAGSLLSALSGEGVFNQSKVLREAVLALVRESEEEGARFLESIDASEFDFGERAWHALIRGWLDLRSGDLEGSDTEFSEAKRYANNQSPALAAQIGYLVFRYQLESEDVSVAIGDLRLNYEASRGLETGFRYGQLLAVALFDEGRSDEAIEVVNEAIEELPEIYADLRDQFLLLQLLLSGPDSDLGQSAARELAVDGNNLSLQQIALQHLISESLGDEGRLGEALMVTLDSIVEGSAAHPLAAEALYYRSVRRYQLRDYANMEDDAYRLMDTFPDSAYRRGSLTLLASASWQRERFRTAASFLSQARSEFAGSLDDEALSILIADCYFRAGLRGQGNSEDFANAAEAYEIALNESSEREMASQIFFQLVLSHLKAGSTETAKAILDDPIRSAKSDALKVWRGEWMLIKQMRHEGQSNEAYERIRGNVNLEGMNSGLELRMLWLGSKLAYESRLYGETEVWVEDMNDVLDEVDFGDDPFENQVRSDGMLTLAESFLKLGDEESEQAGLALLTRLREEFAGSESAERSYIVQARYLSDQELVVEAGQLLTYLFDNFPNSKYAPLALYETALNAEKRGLAEYLKQAMELLDRIAKDYPESDLVYYARLKQGDLLRKLNLYGTAEIVYEQLEDAFGDRPDRYLAQISLADTLIAQASEDPSKFEAGISRLELLMDLPDIPIELRAEAGYKRGNAWENKGERLKAKSAYWDLYDLFVVEEMRIQQLGKKGQYWLSRAMFELAEIFEDEAELDMAIEFYEKIETLGLLGGSAARSRVDQLKRRAPVAEAQ
jgi:TolA-binding protein|tara:strand:- start:1687 stop:4368 length:2682 start_codon:yes stop_codon:yes gene_type:complete